MEKERKQKEQKRLRYLLSSINSNHSATVYKALVEIRKEFITKPHLLVLFVQEGGLKFLIPQLQKENNKIIDVSLSILGYCVLEQEPRVLFRKSGGLPVLTKVLKSVPDNAIQTRACRALGSLAHDEHNRQKLFQLGTHDTIGEIISQSTNEETLCMAIRVVKNLADQKEHVATLGRCYILPKMWALLLKTENENVTQSLLTSLIHISSYMPRFSETVAYHWIGAEDGGKVVARLVELSKETGKAAISGKSLILLQRIVQDRNVRGLLTGKEAFQSLLPLIMEEENSEKGGWSVYLSAALYLCKEKPYGFRQAGGIPILIDLVRRSDPDSAAVNSKIRSHHWNILNTLLAFKHDTEGLNQLVEAGVIEILVQKIIGYTELCRSGKVPFEKLGSEECDKRNTSFPTEQPEESDSQTLSVHISNAESSCNIYREECIIQEEKLLEKSDYRLHRRSKKQYRTTSPSYQAVELEYDQLQPYRESSFSDALNIFGWNPNQVRSELSSLPSSPQSVSGSSSPIHSNWSDSSSDADLSEFSLNSPTHSACLSPDMSPFQSEQSSPTGSPSDLSFSPVFPSPIAVSSEGAQSDEEDTVCYSPTQFELKSDDSDSSSSSPPGKKFKYSSTERQKYCCESELKMSWLHLGQVEGKDYHENWPEFRTDNRLRDPVEWVIYLLHRLSWLPDSPRQLTEFSVVKAIINYLTETPRPIFHACRILFRLSSNPDLFTSLLRTGFSLEVYVRLIRDTNQHCCPLHSSLRRVGEQILERVSNIVSQFGKGEMENLFLKEPENTSIPMVTMATPLVVRSRNTLRKFLMDFGVLDKIWALVQSEEHMVYAVASLSSLGLFLKMEDLLCPQAEKNDLFHSKPCRVVKLEEDVFFQISTTERVGAVRQLLQVPFFQAMFGGRFTESKLGTVQLSNIPSAVLKVILHMIYGCGTLCPVVQNLERLIKSDQLAIDLLQWMDHFLLFQFCESITCLIAGQDWCSFLDFPSVIVAFIRSVGNFSFAAKLKQHLLFLPFSNLANFRSKVKIVQAIIASEIAELVLHEWKTMFQNRLREN